MPFTDGNSGLEQLMFQMKSYKNLTKSTIEVLPSSGQTKYSPNQKVIFTLPYASLISLEDIALHFTFTPTDLTHVSSAANGDATKCIEKLVAPKDVASLIAEIDIKINGQTVQHLTRYNDIVNVLNFFQEPKTKNKALQNNHESDDIFTVSRKQAVNGVWTAGDKTVNPNAADNILPQHFIINKWYGLLGHRGKETSSNFIDTNMLGEITIAFTLASSAVCPSVILDAVQAKAGTTAGLDPAEHAKAIAARRSSYELSDLNLSMVRYNLPTGYSEALASNLAGGAKYQIAFNHYEIHTQHSLRESGTIRWNENSRDIKGLLAFFTNNTREKTHALGYAPTINTSEYFLYDNAIHNNSQFQIGSVKMPQNVLTNHRNFLEIMRAVPGYNIECNSTIKTVEDFNSQMFMSLLSLEMSEGVSGESKLLSGLSSEQLPIACSYTYKNENLAGYAWDKSVNVMSLTTRMLVIQNGQNVYVEI